MLLNNWDEWTAEVDTHDVGHPCWRQTLFTVLTGLTLDWGVWVADVERRTKHLAAQRHYDLLHNLINTHNNKKILSSHKVLWTHTTHSRYHPLSPDQPSYSWTYSEQQITVLIVTPSTSCSMVTFLTSVPSDFVTVRKWKRAFFV